MNQVEGDTGKKHGQAVQVELELFVLEDHVGRGGALTELHQTEDDALLFHKELLELVTISWEFTKKKNQDVQQ